MSTNIATLPMRAIYIGAMVATALWGVTVMQATTYFVRFPNDRWYHRYAVGLLLIIDTLYLVFWAHALYYDLIDSSVNHDAAVLTIGWSTKLDFMFFSLLILLVDIVCAVRIWIFGRFFHKTVPWLIVIVIIATSAIYINEIHALFTLTTYQGATDTTVAKSIEALLATMAGVDIIICGAMSYYLLKSRSVSKFPSTTKPLLVLLRFVIVSGLATTMCALAILITFVAIPDSLVADGIAIPLPGVYLNSLLAMLNMRNTSQEDILISKSGSDELKFKSRSTTSAPDILTDEQDVGSSMANLCSNTAMAEQTDVPDLEV